MATIDRWRARAIQSRAVLRTLQGGFVWRSSQAVGSYPLVRTFRTGYDPSGTILEIGKSDVDKVFKMCYRIDRIMARVAKAKNHKPKEHSPAQVWFDTFSNFSPLEVK